MRQTQPVKKLIFAVITPAIVLSGCGGPATTASEFVSSTAAASTPADSSAALSSTTENNPALPSPVSGSYNGQTVTMQYKMVLDYVWTGDNLRPFAFVNGYLPFYYYGTDNDEDLVGGTYLDKDGRMICEPIYIDVNPFNTEGIGLAKKEDGTWVYLDKNGDESPADEYPKGSILTPGWPGYNLHGERPTIEPAGSTASFMYDNDVVVAYFGKKQYGDYNQLFDTKGNLLNETKFDRIGNFYQGLAPFTLGRKLGLIDSKGNIVIEPTFQSGFNEVSDPLFIGEDLILMNTQGKVGIIEVLRS